MNQKSPRVQKSGPVMEESSPRTQSFEVLVRAAIYNNDELANVVLKPNNKAGEMNPQKRYRKNQWVAELDSKILRGSVRDAARDADMAHLEAEVTLGK